MNKTEFIVPAEFIDNDKESFDVKLKEISYLIFQVFAFLSNGRNKFTTDISPYTFSFLKNKDNHWFLISCKVTHQETNQSITFSFASSIDGSSFQNCSGLYGKEPINETNLNLWLEANQEFLNILKEKKLSYKNNFTTPL